MPNATVDTAETESKDLNTCPGGFVVLRRMSYGEKLHRQGLAMNMKIGAGSGKGKGFEGEMALANDKVTLYEFSVCIVDHNLEDKEGRKLNLTTIQDIKSLHPKIGDEINQLIEDMNNYEVDEGN